MKSFGTLLSLLLGLAVAWTARCESPQVAIKRDIPYAQINGHPLLLDLHLPEGVSKPPLVVFMHGGSWRAGSKKDCPMSWITAKGYALASIDYRLSMEAVFP